MRQRKFENIRARRTLRESNEYHVPTDLMELRQGLYNLCRNMDSLTSVLYDLSDELEDYNNIIDDRILDEIDTAFNFTEEYVDKYDRAKNRLQTILYHRTRG